MNNSKKSLFVTLADRNYLDFAKQLFSSVYFNSGWQGDYMLLAHDVPEIELRWFRDKGILIKHCVPLAEKITGRWPPTVLSKLYLFGTEFKKWDKIIYFDADVVVNGSLDNLLNTDKIACLSNLSRPFFRQVKLKHILKSHGLDEKDFSQINTNLPLFTSCLFVINSEVIGSESFNDLNSLLAKYQNLIGGTDEFVLSLYFAGQWTVLSPIYCLYFNFLKEYGIEVGNIKTMTSHFISYQKPVDYCATLYAQWKDNFEKADKIDLNNRLTAQKILSRGVIKKNHALLKKRILFFWIIRYVHIFIGLLGAVIKRTFPIFYDFFSKRKLFFCLKKSPIDGIEKSERSSYTLRPYKEGDMSELVSVISSIFALMDQNKWFWKYIKHPLGSNILVAENDQGRVVGQFAVLPHRLSYYSDQRIIHQIVDVCLDNPYRNQLFLKRCFSYFIDQGGFLPWGFVSQELNAVYAKAVKAAGVTLPNKTVKFNILEKKITSSFNLKNNQSVELIIKSTAVEKKELDTLWKTKKSEIKIGVIRDFEFIKWRIVDSPEKHRLYLIYSNNSLVGYFSLKINKLVAVISDILVLNEYLDKSLILKIEDFCRGIGLEKIRVVATDKVLLHNLLRNGYYKGNSVYFTYNDSIFPVDSDDLYLTMIDADWDLCL